jgi:hypothetical protein
MRNSSVHTTAERLDRERMGTRPCITRWPVTRRRLIKLNSLEWGGNSNTSELVSNTNGIAAFICPPQDRMRRGALSEHSTRTPALNREMEVISSQKSLTETNVPSEHVRKTVSNVAVVLGMLRKCADSQSNDHYLSMYICLHSPLLDLGRFFSFLIFLHSR